MGPRDVEQGTCVAARRDVPGKEGKQFGVPLEPEAFVAHIQVGWAVSTGHSELTWPAAKQ